MLPGNLSLWLTPVWVLSVGVTMGAIVLLVLFGLLWIVSRGAAAAVLRTVKESILLPISYVVLAFVGFCLVLAPTMPTESFLASLRRLPHVGVLHKTVTVPADSEDFEVNAAFLSDELTHYELESPQDLIIGVEPGKAFTAPLIFLEANEPDTWTPGPFSKRAFNGEIAKLYVTNENDTPVDLIINLQTNVEMPQVQDLPLVATSVVGMYVVYLLIYWLLPGLSVIAMATAKEAVAQPIYILAMVVGAVALVTFIYIPYNTFGEDVKMLKDSGLTTIMVLAIFVGLWTASVSVAEEIEGRTALTLLSKPISRRQFVLGKFLGIIWPIVLLYIVLGVVLLLTVSYKVVYDSRESSNPVPEWQNCYEIMISTVPGLVLALMETIVLVAISVAISTRLPMLPNLLICGTIYVLGHLGPLIVQSSAGQLEYVAFIGRLIAVVLPVLDHFNIQAAVAGGVDIPMAYLGWALLYCALYSAAAMLLALILFEDRDLA
jgi:ABC-type transport system involved in multi-copper enzyme maturation permease subunit